jgi:hypothetical protein
MQLEQFPNSMLNSPGTNQKTMETSRKSLFGSLETSITAVGRRFLQCDMCRDHFRKQTMHLLNNISQKRMGEWCHSSTQSQAQHEIESKCNKNNSMINCFRISDESARYCCCVRPFIWVYWKSIATCLHATVINTKMSRTERNAVGDDWPTNSETLHSRSPPFQGFDDRWWIQEFGYQPTSDVKQWINRPETGRAVLSKENESLLNWSLVLHSNHNFLLGYHSKIFPSMPQYKVYARAFNTMTKSLYSLKQNIF